MSAFRTLDEFPVKGARVILRADLNVPTDGGRISDTTRLDRLVPTLLQLRNAGARVVILSHFGRPKGKSAPEYSLRSVAEELSRCAGFAVAFCPAWRGAQAIEAAASLQDGDCLVLENTRFDAGEEADDPALAQEWAAMGDVFVNDAFSASHRAHASTTGVAKFLPAIAGPQMAAELAALTACLEKPTRPVMAVVGGAKVSTKLEVLTNLTHRVDILVPAGGMANTFLAAMGHNVGASLYEPDMLATARQIIDASTKAGCKLVMPDDLVVTHEIKANAAHRTVALDGVAASEKIVDIGNKTSEHLESLLGTCATLVWNGPLGICEVPPFDRGTNTFARDVARHTHDGNLMSVAGGGDTVAALARAGVSERLSYVSTAGGAFLEWMEGKELPGITPLRKQQ